MNKIATLFPYIKQNEDPNTKFVLTELLAEGSYGSVYKALTTPSNPLKKPKEIAVKLIKLEEYEKVEDLAIEFEVMRKCVHPNIVQYLDGWFIDGSILIIAMELCDGGSTSDIYNDLRRPFTEEELQVVSRDTLLGLQYMLSIGYLHRDIKGANILVKRDGTVKIIDFGVCGRVTPDRPTRRSFVGTPNWMAPEVIATKDGYTYSPYDFHADVWSFGATVLELANAAEPYEECGQFNMGVLNVIVNGPPPSLKSPKSWSKGFKDFLGKCLQKNPSQRWSYSELLAHSWLQKAPSGVAAYNVLSSLVEEYISARNTALSQASSSNNNEDGLMSPPPPPPPIEGEDGEIIMDDDVLMSPPPPPPPSYSETSSPSMDLSSPPPPPPPNYSETSSPFIDSASSTPPPPPPMDEEDTPTTATIIKITASASSSPSISALSSIPATSPSRKLLRTRTLSLIKPKRDDTQLQKGTPSIQRSSSVRNVLHVRHKSSNLPSHISISDSIKGGLSGDGDDLGNRAIMRRQLNDIKKLAARNQKELETLLCEQKARLLDLEQQLIRDMQKTVGLHRSVALAPPVAGLKPVPFWGKQMQQHQRTTHLCFRFSAGESALFEPSMKPRMVACERVLNSHVPHQNAELDALMHAHFDKLAAFVRATRSSSSHAPQRGGPNGSGVAGATTPAQSQASNIINNRELAGIVRRLRIENLKRYQHEELEQLRAKHEMQSRHRKAKAALEEKHLGEISRSSRLGNLQRIFEQESRELAERHKRELERASAESQIQVNLDVLLGRQAALYGRWVKEKEDRMALCEECQKEEIACLKRHEREQVSRLAAFQKQQLDEIEMGMDEEEEEGAAEAEEMRLRRFQMVDMNKLGTFYGGRIGALTLAYSVYVEKLVERFDEAFKRVYCDQQRALNEIRPAAEKIGLNVPQYSVFYDTWKNVADDDDEPPPPPPPPEDEEKGDEKYERLQLPPQSNNNDEDEEPPPPPPPFSPQSTFIKNDDDDESPPPPPPPSHSRNSSFSGSQQLPLSRESSFIRYEDDDDDDDDDDDELPPPPPLSPQSTFIKNDEDDDDESPPPPPPSSHSRNSSFSGSQQPPPPPPPLSRESSFIRYEDDDDDDESTPPPLPPRRPSSLHSRDSSYDELPPPPPPPLEDDY